MLWLYETVHYQVVPPVFILFFTPVVQYLVLVGNPHQAFSFTVLLGNAFSWIFVLTFTVWAIFMLSIPSKSYYGPEALDGSKPRYQDNGLTYYFSTLFIYTVMVVIRPSLPVDIYNNIGYILGTLNIVALLVCMVMLIMGRRSKEREAVPVVYQFYRGMEVHPQWYGVDIKQLTNCRIGMMLWQVLIITYFIAALKLKGFNAGFLVNVGLQTVYIFKFFWWETGYFRTLDITLDRAGYYICWGCLVWVPSFYTFSSYYFVYHLPKVGVLASVIIAVFGLLFIALNYTVDYEKEKFQHHGGACNIWGAPAKYINVQYTNKQGIRKSKLLTSGFWGLARHMNYDFEILLAVAWCFPGYHYGVFPFLYSIFLTILLVHRVFRDEKKCKEKYGTYWDEYCAAVKYRMLPKIF